MLNRSLILLTALLFLAGCKTKKNLSTELERRSTGDLNKCVESALVYPEWYSVRVSTDVDIKDESVSVTANVRIRKDSVIWINVKKAAFQVATLYITPDSIQILNKLNKTYTRADYSLVQQFMDVELDFYMIQALFFGNPVAFDPKERYKKLDDPNNYILSSHTDRQIEKAYEKLPRREEKQYIQRYYVEPETCKIFKTLIEHLADKSSLTILNHDYKKEDSFLFPNKVSLSGKTLTDSVSIDLNFSRYKVDKELSFPFNPSDKYETLELENGNDTPGDSLK